MTGPGKPRRLGGQAAQRPARLRSVLVPLDLTSISDRVLRRVTRLPLDHDAVITLLHVVPDDVPPPYDRDAERYARQSLAEEARELRKHLARGPRVEQVVKVGAVLREIAALAKTAELIVMGRGGERAVRDLFLGSTAERVIRQSKVPVLAVRLPARSAYKRPALALDLGQPAHDVVRMAHKVLAALPQRVPVIHAFTPPYEHMAYPSLPEHVLAQRRADYRHHAFLELSELLATSLVKARVSADEAPAWQLLVRYGPPRATIAKTAKKLQTDLLVLGTHGYAGIAHVLLGTVAGDVLREVSCDVLVVPPASSKKSRPSAS